MDYATLVIESVSFASPSWALIVAPILVSLAWHFSSLGKRGVVALTGLEYVRASVAVEGRRRKAARFLLWGALAAGLGVLWAGPVLRTPEPIMLGGLQSVHKHFIVALDISPSMNLSMKKPEEEADLAELERAARGLGTGDEGATRYEAARNAVYHFVERFAGERIGLILFSTEPFIARWPTVETGELFAEVLDESIRRGAGTQLGAFAGLTNIDSALDEARKVFGTLAAAQGKAVILISDAEDEVEKMGAAAKRLREDGIRLYTIGVGISEGAVQELSEQFTGDPGFRVFHVDSPEEMDEAYLLISELEESPVYGLNQSEFVVDLRSLLALALVVIAGILVWIAEARLHQSLSADTGNSVTQRKRHGF